MSAPKAWGKYFRRFPVSPLVVRLAAYVIAFSSVLALSITVIDLTLEYRRDLKGIDDRMRQIEAVYLEGITENLWVNDRAQLDTALQGMIRLPDLVMAEIRVNGKTELRRGAVLSGEGLSRSFVLQRMHRDQVLVIGELVVSATYDGVYQRLFSRLMYYLLANTFKTLMVALFIFMVFYMLVGRHLRHMARYARESSGVDQDDALRLQRRQPPGEDELDVLAGSINHMRDELHAVNQVQRERADLLEKELEARRLAESRLHLMVSVFQSSQEAIMLTDAQSRIMATNSAFERLTGYSNAEVLGKNPKLLSAGMTSPNQYRQMWSDLTSKGVWQGEVWDRRRDGSVYPKWLSISAVRDGSGVLTNYIGIFADITERRQAEEKIFNLAYHDSLTGLYNRSALRLELNLAIARARMHGQMLAVLSMDLDLFKNINNVFGHHIGDQVLVEVSQRLKAAVRDGDVVARLTGDEFAVVLYPVADMDEVIRIAEIVRRGIEQPYMVEDKTLRSTSSIGLAMYPVDGDDVDALLKRAEVAMFHAQEQGRNGIEFYTASQEQAAHERLQFEHDLRQALELRQFELHYQPKVEARSHRLVGLEALLRWHHPVLGPVPPDRFIPVAESIGLVQQIGEWVLDEACRQMRVWCAQGVQGIESVAVNLSAQQLNSGELLGFIEKTLGKHGLEVQCLELEITESMLMQDIEANVQRLQALRDMGIKLSIDDFGTGYSSLAYLKLLPVHALKLDRSFVHDIEADAGSAAICVSTIALAHNLGLKVIAEGVETVAQRDFLERHRCDLLQGYLLGRPVPADQLLVDIARHQAEG
jgi:diguanylate cyclase (GGDEF)-like protein/PAS domain S-box-containing protein